MTAKASNIIDTIACGLDMSPAYINWISGNLRRAGLLPPGKRGRGNKGGADYDERESVLLLLGAMGVSAAKDAPRTAAVLFGLRLRNVTVTTAPQNGDVRSYNMTGSAGAADLLQPYADMSFGEALIDTMRRGISGPGTKVQTITVGRDAKAATLTIISWLRDPRTREPVSALTCLEYAAPDSIEPFNADDAETEMAASLTAHPFMAPVSIDRLIVSASAPAAILDAMAEVIGDTHSPARTAEAPANAA